MKNFTFEKSAAEKSAAQRQLNFNFIKKHKCVLLENSENEVCIGICKELDFATKRLLELSFNKKITYEILSQKEFSNIISNAFDFEFEKDTSETENNDIEEINKEAPAVNLLNAIFQEAIKENASDIHFESNDKTGIVRFRIAGDLSLHQKINLELFNSISSRIKILADLNILEKRLPQDGRIKIQLEKSEIDLRVSIVPSSKGESIVLRILKKDKKLFSLEELGFSENQLSTIKKMISCPNGLILISGPTGSGKTTTLNSILTKLADGRKKIISIEDPVEYTIENVNQIQINENIGLTFESILRRVLRQDPNIIMLGEIRDKTTAELCIRAALTGHLVFSTVHTNNAVSIITRLLNLGVENFMIAAVLRGIISQRLVKTFSTEKPRTVISESLFIDKKIQNLISKDFSENALNSYLLKNNFEFIKDDAQRKIKSKICSVENVKKEIFMEN